MSVSPQRELMQLIESDDERPDNHFTLRFDHLEEFSLFGRDELISPRKLNFEKIEIQEQAFYALKEDPYSSYILEPGRVYLANQDIPLEKVKEEDCHYKEPRKANYEHSQQVKIEENSKKTTRFCTKIEEDGICDMDNRSSPMMVAEFNQQGPQQGSLPSQEIYRREKKISRKHEKYVFRQNFFKKSLKISFPKKLVQMFINHYQEYLDEEDQIFQYNNNLKQKLKQNKKNDYTFQKEVSHILGEAEGQKDLAKKISQANRQIFSEIISDTMKEEVIMRDKIAKNRELYMLQLKIYALRCRSHKLSKKGTFK